MWIVNLGIIAETFSNAISQTLESLEQKMNFRKMATVRSGNVIVFSGLG